MPSSGVKYMKNGLLNIRLLKTLLLKPGLAGVYMPDKLASGRHECIGIDYTHIASRSRRMKVQDKMPGDQSEPWRTGRCLEEP